MNINRIPVAFYGKRKVVAPEISYKYNQKQVLEIQGFYGLPDYFRVDFANEGDTLAKSVIGTPDGIEIPDEYLLTGKAIKVYIVLGGPDESVQTVAEIDIPVRGRLPVSEETPTPEERSIIDELIAALNDGVERAETAAENAEQKEADASADALKAEGYALGTQDGQAVEEGSDYYHNNAAYFSGQASAQAEAAAGSASAAGAAKTDAEAARAGAEQAEANARTIVDGAVVTVNQARDAAVQTVQQEGEAQTAAARAQAEAAARSATASADSAADSATARIAAEDARDAAVTAQEKTEDAQSAAEDAQEAAETAQGLSERAQAAAEEAARQAGERVGMIHDIDNQKYYSVSQEVRNGFLVETFTEVQNP